MCWLTEISGYTNRINKMRKQVQALKFRSDVSATNEAHALIQLNIQITSRKLNTIEHSIIHTIKENTNHVNYSWATETKLAVTNEEELYENMKYGYELFIDLQQSFNMLLKEGLAVKPTPKIIAMCSTLKRHDVKIKLKHGFAERCLS